MIEGVDYSYDPPDAGLLALSDKKFAVRYGGVGNTAKWLTANEVLKLQTADVNIVANAEKTPAGYKGTAAGVEWAKAADAHFKQLGMPEDRPIYFSVDWDAQPSDWPAIDAALLGSASVIGADRVGVYGGYNTIAHCVTAGTAAWFWQTYAWSGGKWHSRCNLQQYKNNVPLGTGTVDLDRAMTEDYGQWYGDGDVANWYLDHGLVTLTKQLELRYKGLTVYSVGDLSHKQGVSDHNPEADNSVDAIDVMIRGPFTAANAEWLFDTLTKYRDRRIAYFIYNRRIVSSTVQPWKVRGYTGSNPHTDHVHLSVNDKYENNIAPWNLGGSAVAEKKVHTTMVGLDDYSFPVLRQGMNDKNYAGYNMVYRLQLLVGAKVDSDYGPETAKKVKAKLGGKVDGKTVGEKEWCVIAGFSTRPGN
jgi:hypothetical protein